jgi:hypothetical protein
MNARVSDLMDKEISRKEFLGMLGLTVASIFGLGTVLKLLTGKSLENHRVLSGYGSSTYGGK